jgi:hypothetical protein
VMDGRLSTRPGGATSLVVRCPGHRMTEELCELAGVCLALLAVRESEEAYVYAVPGTQRLIENVVAGEVPPLPGAVAGLFDEVRPRLGALRFAEHRPQNSRYGDQRPSLMARLPDPAADPLEIRALEEVAAAVREGVRAHVVPPVRQDGRPGFTADYGMTAGGGVCVGTDGAGRPYGDTYAVRLPAPLDPHWGEAAAVLMAVAHARSTGRADPTVYTDAASVVSRLRKVRSLRHGTPPPLIRQLLENRRVRPLRRLDVRWVQRSSTEAQMAADQVARHVSSTGRITLRGVRELRLDAFLNKPAYG